MRKIFTPILTLLVLLVCNIHSTAQVSNYGFAQSSGTYFPVTGTTVFTSGWDDNTPVSVTLPFTFTFNGIPYTSVFISTNGFITFGATPGGANYNPISSTTGYAGAISAFGRDLISNAATIEQATTGASPNQQFVVQWNNARRYSGGAVTGDVLNFQVILNETSNTIQVVYGTCTATNATGLTCQVGLRGATNTDFNNRTTTSDWSATTMGALNNQACTSSNLIMPASGLTFSWFPASPCVPGSLNGGSTVGPPGAVCAGGSFNVSVSGGSFGTGLTYAWEFSLDNVAWNPVSPAATGQVLTTNINVNTYFRRKITCGGTDAYSTSTLVTVSGAIATPFTETFSGYVTLFPPSCWGNSNPTFLTGVAPSAYGIGSGSARFNFFNSTPPVTMDLTTPLFAAVPANYRLTFDHAYATYSGENDQLQILYSVNGGATYSSLVTYDGGTSGPLNTAGSTTNLFSPTADQWASKDIALPVGTNKLIFRGITAFGNNLFIDNITVEPIPPCLPPTGLTTGAMTPISAVLNWTASLSNPSGGYEWEVRTSGVPGSGATGLATNGLTGAGVVTATAIGLTPNTTYSAYVRSDCGAGVFSTWTRAYVFTTPCNPIATPFVEAFTTYSTTFPPSCWTRNSTTYLVGDAATAYGVGIGSAKFDFYNASAGTNLDFVSPLFVPVPAGWRCTFDHAYATFSGEVDQLQISYSTDGGGTWSSLITYLGGTTGPLNTGGGVLPPFTPLATQWTDKAVDLPPGTNRLRFRGVSAFGNNLYLDNITVEQTPSCLPVSNLKVLPITPTTVVVSFTPPATTPTVGYIVEYGPVNFVPGTTNAPGTGGTIGAIGTGSPIEVTGLSASTTYDFYVRKICIAGADYSINKKATATTLCPATNIPYLQNFESAVVPRMPVCTSSQDVNGASGSFWAGSGGGSWETYTDASPLTYVSPSKALLYFYDFNDLTRGADDWFYTQGLNLTAGTTYRLKFFYKALDGVNYPEKMEIKFGTRAYAPDMTSGTLFVNNNISSVYANPFDSVKADFTPTTSGVYYIGFHAMSDGDEFGILVDDISVKISPLVDVGITGITLPSLTCPTNNVFVQATVTNFNLTTLNFATYPVTVTANITGAATGTLTTVLNSGSLAPGASISVYLNPGFNFAAGAYNITVATSTSPAGNDPETGNDSYSKVFAVNPDPPAPVITPPSPGICIGTPVPLSTQFTASPPPVTLPAFTSGTIAVAVPDGSSAGATHTLAVSGVPANATIVSMSVTINMTHTWVGDMIFNLKAPNGRILNLDKYLGGTDASGTNFINTVISSPPAPPTPNYPALASGSAPRTGTYRPDILNNVLTAFGIQNPNGYPSDAAGFSDLWSVPNGNWTLAMADGVGFDVGTLTSWSITISYQIVTPTITWTPVTGLYTNAGATTAYTAGSNAYSLYANPAATTTYTVTATTAAGCSATGSVTVTVNPYPVVTIGSIPDTVCISDQLIPLVATPVGGSWSGPGVSGLNFVPPATAVGSYTLTYSYTSPFGCTTTSTRKIVVKECPERIILLRDNAVMLYPNPNDGQFNLRINSVLYNNLLMRVYTNTGMLVKTQQLGGLTWGRVVPIDLTNLPGGVYMVRLYYDGGTRTAEKTFKVIIGH